ncbi:FAD-binding oxidoreductase [Kistimonas asteriae]|uniref:FAD-binding oxidoreductase n=1 Tax=Kistimonas asteriae TaxID=517724 RepID=UPI001BA6AB2E|nr:FAD-binding oxidoreductase [Kistimonas asteriae]
MNTQESVAEALKACLGSKEHYPLILSDCEDCNGNGLLYEQARQVFNRKFQFRPSAIVFVENSCQVSDIVQFANQHNINIRVRSGGHDHEGECSATDVILIDFSKMNRVTPTDAPQGCDETADYVAIQPGARFVHVKAELDQLGQGIPHGTCQTVGIAGYTLGGGWGPWTRKYGMGCEYLVAATIVLGDGQILQVDATSRESRLLWALRGGGGFSYGIVTELVFKAFKLPLVAFDFHLPVNQYFPNLTAVEVLEAWEKLITPGEHPNLIGTNLKINTKALAEGETPDPDAKLDCIMNGYVAAEWVDLMKLIIIILNHFDPKGAKSRNPADIEKSINKKGLKIFAYHADKTLKRHKLARSSDWSFASWDRHQGSAQNPELHLDGDCPAPHKITSRLVDACGWDKDSRKALICSLQSPLLPRYDGPEKNCEDKFRIHTYITLGAISGEYYNHHIPNDELGCAFPYNDRPFTLQYQAWWDQPERNETTGKCESGCSAEHQVIQNRFHSNRAEDWIATCRNYPIPHTSGAFISFKDASIPTATYFGNHYQDLIQAKLDYSRDKNCLFRSRKTIL